MIIKAKTYHNYYRLKLRLIPLDQLEKNCLFRMAEYSAVAECRKDIFNKVPTSHEDEVLKVLKTKAIEKRSEYVESRRTPEIEAYRTQMFKRDESERKKRKDNAPNAKYMDDIIPADLKEKWDAAKEAFIKHFYYWHGFRTDYAMECFVTYMDHFKAPLFNKILKLTKHENMKLPEKERLQLPLVGGVIPDEEKIDEEVEECAKWLELCQHHNTSRQSILEKVYKAYGLIHPIQKRKFK